MCSFSVQVANGGLAIPDRTKRIRMRPVYHYKRLFPLIYLFNARSTGRRAPGKGSSGARRDTDHGSGGRDATARKRVSIVIYLHGIARQPG